MFSLLRRRGTVSGGSKLASKLSPGRAISFVPRLQAQTTETDNKRTVDGDGASPQAIDKTPPARETASTVRPVATAVRQNSDEFWRKVPLWENVSAEDFLSYRWSVRLACFESRGLNSS